MAGKKSSADNRKVTFGKRKRGKASKTKGPKDKPVKQYQGQGR